MKRATLSQFSGFLCLQKNQVKRLFLLNLFLVFFSIGNIFASASATSYEVTIVPDGGTSVVLTSLSGTSIGNISTSLKITGLKLTTTQDASGYANSVDFKYRVNSTSQSTTGGITTKIFSATTNIDIFSGLAQGTYTLKYWFEVQGYTTGGSTINNAFSMGSSGSPLTATFTYVSLP